MRARRRRCRLSSRCIRSSLDRQLFAHVSGVGAVGNIRAPRQNDGKRFHVRSQLRLGRRRRSANGQRATMRVQTTTTPMATRAYAHACRPSHKRRQRLSNFGDGGCGDGGGDDAKGDDSGGLRHDFAGRSRKLGIRAALLQKCWLLLFYVSPCSSSDGAIFVLRNAPPRIVLPTAAATAAAAAAMATVAVLNESEKSSTFCCSVAMFQISSNINEQKSNSRAYDQVDPRRRRPLRTARGRRAAAGRRCRRHRCRPRSRVRALGLALAVAVAACRRRVPPSSSSSSPPSRVFFACVSPSFFCVAAVSCSVLVTTTIAVATAVAVAAARRYGGRSGGDSDGGGGGGGGDDDEERASERAGGR